MMCKACPSCGGDLSSVPVKQKRFTQFLVKVVRCPHCSLRTTLLTRRKAMSGKLGFRIGGAFESIMSRRRIELL
jgi:hypothetical protein